MKCLFSILTLSFLLAGELEVEGDLKVTGNIDAEIIDNLKLPPGIIFPFAGQSAPEGYLICAGQEVSRQEYSDLFEVIGELYGSGDGETTFNLPDLRGRMPLGKDNMNGASANRVENAQADSLSGNAGEENHQLTVDELAEHNHPMSTHFISQSPGVHNVTGSRYYFHDDNWDFVNRNTDSAGGNQPHNNMPPYLTLNYLIKY